MKRNDKKTIKYQLIKRVSILVLFIFIIISLGFNILISDYIENNAREALSQPSDRIYFDREKPPEPEDGAMPMRRPELQTFKTEIVILTDNYEVVTQEEFFRFRDDTDLVDFVQGISSEEPFFENGVVKKVENEDKLYYYTTIENENLQGSHVVFYINMTDLNEFKGSLNNLLWIAMIAALLTALIGTYMISKRIAEPIKHISNYAKNIGEGDYKLIQEEFDGVELDNLKKSINETSRKLKAYDSKQKVFFQNVSHELRTPLQIIKTNAEAIEAGIFNKEEAISVIKDETNNLTELVEDILILSRLEMESNEIISEEKDLRESLSYVVEKFNYILKEKDIKVSFDFDDDPVLFKYDEKSMDKVFKNLISNAVRHTKDKIDISCRQINDRILVTIRDNGKGISKEELPHIFDRFYKGEGGIHGIGLSIVKSIISSYNGRIEVDSGPDGSSFRIFF